MGTNGTHIGLDELDLEYTGDTFDEDGDEKTRLLGTLVIAGVSHHVELVQVETDKDGVQRAVGPYDDVIDALAAIDCDGGWHTIEHEGREYVAHMSPYC